MSDVLKVSLYISQFLMWNLNNDIWLLKAENANQPQPFVSSIGNRKKQNKPGHF